MIINHNLMAMNTHRQLGMNNVAGQKSIEKLSSGFRINRAGDDAAGLAISEKMRGQIRGLNQASRNSQDGISLIQTAEGALNETHDILQRMRELAVQAANDTNVNVDRSEIQKEVDQLAVELTRISNTTEFNTQNLLAGGLDDTFHVGANSGQNLVLQIAAMDAKSLGVAADRSSVTEVDPSTTGLTSTAVLNEGLGRGIAAGDYTISVTHNAANSTLDGETTTGAVGFTDAATYTGQRDETVQFKVTGTGRNAADDADTVTAAMYSTDGGKTWNAINVAVADTESTITYKGVDITIAAAAGNAVDQTATVSFTAKYDELQLKSGTSNIGDAVKTYQGQTSVTIGDFATGQTMNVTGSFGGLTTATATVSVATTQSKEAVIGADGSVAEEAVAVAGIDISSQKSADKAITTINDALERVSAERSKLGALQNRLEHTIKNLDTSAENLQAAESRIRDVDMAKEMMEFTKNSILQQAATAMLAQANMAPQAVLQLLR